MFISLMNCFTVALNWKQSEVPQIYRRVAPSGRNLIAAQGAVSKTDGLGLILGALND